MPAFPPARLECGPGTIGRSVRRRAELAKSTDRATRLHVQGALYGAGAPARCQMMLVNPRWDVRNPIMVPAGTRRARIDGHVGAERRVPRTRCPSWDVA